jgi:ABC-type transport system involved in multi-copper enzyme maturation permease subunit
MSRDLSSEPPEGFDHPVGPFSGFGNFFRKELRDWWNSWRLILIFLIPTIIEVLVVLFPYRHLMRQDVAIALTIDGDVRKGVATFFLTSIFVDLNAALFILIIIFSTMGILTTEKTSGTLAWNLTKPLGRTGLFVAKWLGATVAIWVAAIVLPVVVATAVMIGYNGVTPDFANIAAVVGIAAAWVGFWVLFILTISLGFRSQAAVGAIAIAFWIVPFVFGILIGEVFGEETKRWIMDRLATRSPFWAASIVLDQNFLLFARSEMTQWKTVWLYAFAVWTVVLTLFSLRVFSRQEIGT